MDGYASRLVEAFDTSILSKEDVDWIRKGSMNQVRESFGCHVGKFEGSHGIFAAGGNAGNGLTLDSVEFYEIAKDSWKAVGSLNHARNSFPMSLVGGQIVVTGGQSSLPLTSVEVFDGTSWVELDQLRAGRAHHVAVSVPAGKLSCTND